MPLRGPWTPGCEPGPLGQAGGADEHRPLGAVGAHFADIAFLEKVLLFQGLET